MKKISNWTVSDTGQKAQYKTRQYVMMMDYLAALGDEHATIAQVEAHFERQGIPIGKATIYRHLEKLAAQGIVRKYTLDGIAGACYQYQPERTGCDAHFHLKCERCGRLVHLDCEETQAFQQHVADTHGFHANYSKTVIYGLCKNCQKEETGNR